MVDTAYSETVAYFAGSDENETLGESIVLEPSKCVLRAVHFVTSDRSAQMFSGKSLDRLVEYRADVIGEGVAVLGLHWACFLFGRDAPELCSRSRF